MALLITQYGIRWSSYYRERGNLNHVVIVFWVEGEGAISSDWLMIPLMQIKTTASLIVCSVLINGKVEDSWDWEHINVFQQSSLYSLQIATPWMSEAFTIAASWNYSCRSNHWWFALSTNGFRYEPRLAKSDQGKHGCIILCGCSSVNITHNHEISIHNWISFEYRGMLTGKLCPWHITLNVQTYMFSSLSSERLGIRSRWNEFLIQRWLSATTLGTSTIED